MAFVHTCMSFIPVCVVWPIQHQIEAQCLFCYTAFNTPSVSTGRRLFERGVYSRKYGKTNYITISCPLYGSSAPTLGWYYGSCLKVTWQIANWVSDSLPAFQTYWLSIIKKSLEKLPNLGGRTTIMLTNHLCYTFQFCLVLARAKRQVQSGLRFFFFMKILHVHTRIH